MCGMELEYGYPFQKGRRKQLLEFLAGFGLDYEESIGFSVILTENREIIATGSLDGNILKCIAVSDGYQGEGLSATLITELRKEAFSRGIDHLFLYSKPENLRLFEPLGFYAVAQTAGILLMENIRGGAQQFASSLDCPVREGIIGSVVANCNPFTNGHRYLIEAASKQCDWLHLFVLSEERSMFSFSERFMLVKNGTADLPNLSIHPTGGYLVSFATFPAYFIHDKIEAGNTQCGLDIKIFTEYFARRLNISKRFVGTEPLSPVTDSYNRQLMAQLPLSGIRVTEVPRKCSDGRPISASRVRELLAKNDFEAIKPLVPPTTYRYLLENYRKQ